MSVERTLSHLFRWNWSIWRKKFKTTPI